jgi:hypothetical protein
MINHFQSTLFNNDLKDLFGSYYEVKNGIRELEEMDVIEYVEADLEDFAFFKRS